MHTYRGFTLIELLVTITIAAILAAIGVPNLSDFIKNNRLTTTANDLLADLALARSEAAKRGQPVSVCPSSNGSTCSTGSWTAGRIVFSDSGSSGTVDGPDIVIRLTESSSPGISIVSSGFANTSYIRYISSGAMSTGNTNLGAFKICDDRNGAFGKLVSISNTGRASIQSGQTCP